MGWDFLDCKLCHLNSMANHRSREKEHRFKMCAQCEEALKNLKLCPDCKGIADKDHYKLVPVDPSITYWGPRVEVVKCPRKAG